MSNLNITHPYSLELTFSGIHREQREIRDFNDIDAMLKKLFDHLNSSHTAMRLDFRGIAPNEIAARIQSYQKSVLSERLLFNIFQRGMGIVVVHARPLKVENLGNGKTRSTFANGVVEEFTLQNDRYHGMRLFPNGKKEQGEFHSASREFLCGYQKETDGNIRFFYPKPLLEYDHPSEKCPFLIVEVEEKLVVLAKMTDELDRTYYEKCDIPVKEVITRACSRPHYNNDSITKVLLHKDFEEQLDLFINHVFSPDLTGSLRIFKFIDTFIKEFIEIAAKRTDFDPLKIIDPLSGRNLFTEAAYQGNLQLIAQYIEIFPQAFLAVAQDVIAEYIYQGHNVTPLKKLVFEFERLGGKLDTYHAMLVNIAKGTKPPNTFKLEFANLPIEHQKTLYEIAYTYNNPFVYEPSELSIKADQYSMNLMWINDKKMSSDEEFLMGGIPQLFQTVFVQPVSKWAKANPGTQVNIWVDGNMATSNAIERSRYAIEKALEGTLHGTVVFRDVRSIDLVRANPQVFDEEMSVYFRVDLLRAIAADYTLGKKETQYFVYGDIDMKPLSGPELFDKKTLSFLDDFGFVMAKDGILGFENGFQILNGNNFQFMNSHRQVIIDLSIEMALKKPNEIHEEQIYDTYPAMITHFLAANGRYGKLSDPKFEYLLSKSKYNKCFRYDIFGSSADSTLPLSNKKIQLKNIMPLKPVRLPPSHFN